MLLLFRFSSLCLIVWGFPTWLTRSFQSKVYRMIVEYKEAKYVEKQFDNGHSAGAQRLKIWWQINICLRTECEISCVGALLRWRLVQEPKAWNFGDEPFGQLAISRGRRHMRLPDDFQTDWAWFSRSKHGSCGFVEKLESAQNQTYDITKIIANTELTIIWLASI